VRIRRHVVISCAALNLSLGSAFTRAQGVDVTAHVRVQDTAATSGQKREPSSSDVVVWLAPTQPGGPSASTGHPGPFRLIQKDKQFAPHLLVVPTGTSVEFPNEDPFFHNVFSLFNGKRFDLGLYESGTSRAVHFDRQGVSYIFCNIHPEMGAVVVALNTPYFMVSTNTGAVVIHNVLPGTYHLHVWSEAAQFANPADSQRIIQVGETPVHLGEIVLQAAADPMAHHKNKFGEDYHPDKDSPY
jgi:plastocyanin